MRYWDDDIAEYIEDLDNYEECPDCLGTCLEYRDLRSDDQIVEDYENEDGSVVY